MPGAFRNYEPFDIDLGGGHGVIWWRDAAGVAKDDGAHWFHPPGPNARPDSLAREDGECVGGFHLREGGWQLVQREPLTIAPSLLCACGAHIFIQGGKAVVV